MFADSPIKAKHVFLLNRGGGYLISYNKETYFEFLVQVVCHKIWYANLRTLSQEFVAFLFRFKFVTLQPVAVVFCFVFHDIESQLSSFFPKLTKSTKY